MADKQEVKKNRQRPILGGGKRKNRSGRKEARQAAATARNQAWAALSDDERTLQAAANKKRYDRASA